MELLEQRQKEEPQLQSSTLNLKHLDTTDDEAQQLKEENRQLREELEKVRQTNKERLRGLRQNYEALLNESEEIGQEYDAEIERLRAGLRKAKKHAKAQ